MREKIQSKTEEELIIIIENPENYQVEFYQLACEEFTDRTISDELLYQIAEGIYREKVIKLLQKSYLNADEMILPKSHLLNESQRLEIFKDEFEENQVRREAMNKGLDRYWA